MNAKKLILWLVGANIVTLTIMLKLCYNTII